MAVLVLCVVVPMLFVALVAQVWSRAARANLEHPLRDFLITGVAGLIFELLSIAALWNAGENHPIVGNVALFLQVPGLLLSNVLGFGFHSEGGRLKVFYILMAVVNAITYSCVFLLGYAFTQRRSRT